MNVGNISTEGTTSLSIPLNVSGLITAHSGISTNNNAVNAGTGNITCGSITCSNSITISQYGFVPVLLYSNINLNTNGGGNILVATLPSAITAGHFKIIVDGANKSDPNLMSTAELICGTNGNSSYVYNVANNGYFTWQG